MEMRKKIYCMEHFIPVEQEFDEVMEKNSRHIVCYGKRFLWFIVS